MEEEQMAELRDRLAWQTEIKEMLVGTHGMAVDVTESDTETTMLVGERNGLRYTIVITPEGN
jgi:hypothetical protein